MNECSCGKSEHTPLIAGPASRPALGATAAKITCEPVSRTSRISVNEIARRLGLGRVAVYSMLEQGIIPAIRLGRRWIITRQAFDQWERTCGTQTGAGLLKHPEVTVLN